MCRKVMPMAAAAELVKDGQMLALGGNALHRTPAAYAHALARLKRFNLKIAGAAPAMRLTCSAQPGLWTRCTLGSLGLKMNTAWRQDFARVVRRAGSRP